MRAGLVLGRAKPVRQPFLGVAGVVYPVGTAELQVFLYPTAAARRRDTERLDSLTVSPRDERIVWKQPPTLVVSHNLAAIILSLNERQTERIALALGAGMPLEPPSRP
jgi:hypothetical protein